jgi:hypothetical protein
MSATDRADIGRARELATAAHDGQVDKAGRAYLEHPAEVAERVRGESAVVQVVAWLHDVVEDTEVTLDRVREQFGDEVASAVDAITHRGGEPRVDYYARVAANPTALRVKEADLADNTDPWRMRRLEPVLRARLAKKYAGAYAALGLTPAEPIVPAGRILVTVGDIIARGRDKAIIAWVGEGPKDVVVVFTACDDGQFRGTAAVRGALEYHGLWDDEGHVFSVADTWTVSDPQWDL